MRDSFIIYFLHKLHGLKWWEVHVQTGKTTTTRRAAVRETCTRRSQLWAPSNPLDITANRLKIEITTVCPNGYFSSRMEWFSTVEGFKWPVTIMPIGVSLPGSRCNLYQSAFLCFAEVENDSTESNIFDYEHADHVFVGTQDLLWESDFKIFGNYSLQKNYKFN